MTKSKDYLIRVNIRNAPFKRAMERAGIETAAELSRRSGVNQGTIGKYFGLKLSPYAGRSDKYGIARGDERPSIIKIVEVLGCSINDLFPPQHLDDPLENNSAQIEADLEDIKSITQTVQAIDMENQIENRQIINKLFEGLDDREEVIVRRRTGYGRGASTYRQIGADLGITGGRVQQIEERALRKMRNPRHKRELGV